MGVNRHDPPQGTHEQRIYCARFPKAYPYADFAIINCPHTASRTLLGVSTSEGSRILGLTDEYDGTRERLLTAGGASAQRELTRAMLDLRRKKGLGRHTRLEYIYFSRYCGWAFFLQQVRPYSSSLRSRGQRGQSG